MNKSRTHAQRKFAAVTPALAGSSSLLSAPTRTTPVSAPPPGPRTHLPPSTGDVSIIHMNVHQLLDLVSTSRLQRAFQITSKSDPFHVHKESIEDKKQTIVDENTDPVAVKPNIIDKPKIFHSVLDFKRDKKQPIVRLRKSDVKIAFLSSSNTTIKLLPTQANKEPNLKIFNKISRRVIRPVTRSKSTGRMSLRSRNIRTFNKTAPVKSPSRLSSSKISSPPNPTLKIELPKEVINGRILRNRSVKRIISNRRQPLKVGKTFTRFRARQLKKQKVLKTSANMSEFSSEDETPLKFFPKNSSMSNDPNATGGNSSQTGVDDLVSSTENVSAKRAKLSPPTGPDKATCSDVTKSGTNTVVTRKRSLTMMQSENFEISNIQETANVNLYGDASSGDPFRGCALDSIAGCSDWEGVRDVDNKLERDYLLGSDLFDPYVPLPTLRPEDLKCLETKSDNAEITEEKQEIKPKDDVVSVEKEKVKEPTPTDAAPKTSDDKKGEVYEFSTLENDPPPIVGFQAKRRSTVAKNVTRSYYNLTRETNRFLIEEHAVSLPGVGTKVECKLVLKKDLDLEKITNQGVTTTTTPSSVMKYPSANLTAIPTSSVKPSNIVPVKIIKNKCETVTKDTPSTPMSETMGDTSGKVFFFRPASKSETVFVAPQQRAPVSQETNDAKTILAKSSSDVKSMVDEVTSTESASTSSFDEKAVVGRDDQIDESAITSSEIKTDDSKTAQKQISTNEKSVNVNKDDEVSTTKVSDDDSKTVCTESLPVTELAVQLAPAVPAESPSKVSEEPKMASKKSSTKSKKIKKEDQPSTSKSNNDDSKTLRKKSNTPVKSAIEKDVVSSAPAASPKSKAKKVPLPKRKAAVTHQRQTRSTSAEKIPPAKMAKKEKKRAASEKPATRAKTQQKNANKAMANYDDKAQSSKHYFLDERIHQDSGPPIRKSTVTAEVQSGECAAKNDSKVAFFDENDIISSNLKSSASKGPFVNNFKCSNQTVFPKLNERPQIVEAPVYKPTEEEFQDPLKYIEAIMPHASQFGLCKIIPPTKMKKEELKATLNLPTEVKFTANNQYIHRVYQRWGPATHELCSMRKYASRQGVPFDRNPLIDGVELNLVQLYRVVQQNGGINFIMGNAKWNIVATLMKLNSNKKSWHILDGCYVKYLLDYDTCNERERNQCAKDVQEGWTQKYKKMVARAQNPKHRQRKLLGLTDSSEDSDSDDSDRALSETDECIVRGRQMTINYFQQVAETVYRMLRDETPWVRPEQAEREYWNLVLSRHKHVCVYAGAVDSGEQGLGWPKNARNQPPWNLKTLSDDPNSVLRSLGPVLGLTVPTIHLGMLFSTSCWNRDPHGLPWIEYHHDGASKIWYGIPEEYSDNFKNAVKKLAPSCCLNKTIWLPSDVVMIPPVLLIENGVAVSRIVQEPGEIIIVFPKAYTSSICTGYSVSESVYFGPKDWLATCHQEFKEAEESCEPTMFPLEQLLISIANDPRASNSVLLQTYCILKNLLDEEKLNRKKLTKQLNVKMVDEKDIKQKKRRTYAETVFECDVCRASLYLSKVIGLNDPNGTLCCKHALAIADNMGKKKEPIPASVSFVALFTNEQIDGVMLQLEKRIFPY